MGGRPCILANASSNWVICARSARHAATVLFRSAGVDVRARYCEGWEPGADGTCGPPTDEPAPREPADPDERTDAVEWVGLRGAERWRLYGEPGSGDSARALSDGIEFERPT